MDTAKAVAGAIRHGVKVESSRRSCFGNNRSGSGRADSSNGSSEAEHALPVVLVVRSANARNESHGARVPKPVKEARLIIRAILNQVQTVVKML